MNPENTHWEGFGVPEYGEREFLQNLDKEIKVQCFSDGVQGVIRFVV